MTERSIVVFGAVLWLTASAFLSGAWAQGETPQVTGLWLLMAIMPAGVIAHETLVSPSERLQYWFTDDKTVTMSRESSPSRKLKKGVWSQRANRLVVSWEDGSAQELVIVRATGDGLILAGFDPRPLWYRFTRVF